MTEEDRNKKGQWVKGQSGNPNGRPKRAVEETFYKTTKDSVSLEDWKAVILKAVEMAKKGNKDARKFLAEYLMGAPQQYLDISQDLSIELTWGDEEEDANQNQSQEALT